MRGVRRKSHKKTLPPSLIDRHTASRSALCSSGAVLLFQQRAGLKQSPHSSPSPLRDANSPDPFRPDRYPSSYTKIILCFPRDDGTVHLTHLSCPRSLNSLFSQMEIVRSRSSKSMSISRIAEGFFRKCGVSCPGWPLCDVLFIRFFEKVAKSYLVGKAFILYASWSASLGCLRSLSISVLLSVCVSTT
jgi:hypothetical protein